jgi:ParB-like chromosome segregation protein Spo0J
MTGADVQGADAPTAGAADRADVAALIAANKACGYEFHPAANLIPPMTQEEFDDLVADIKTHGLNEPITIHEGMILDGRHRALACDKIGIKPWRQESPSNDPLAYVLSVDIHRRHLTAEQRIEVAEKLAKADPAMSARRIAKLANISPTTAVKAKTKVQETGDVSTVDTSISIDTKGRKQPAKKPATAKKATAATNIVSTAKTAPVAKNTVADKTTPTTGNDVDTEQSQRKQAAADETASEAASGGDDELVLLREFARFVIDRATVIRFEAKDHAEFKVLLGRVKQVLGGGK